MKSISLLDHAFLLFSHGSYVAPHSCDMRQISNIGHAIILRCGTHDRARKRATDFQHAGGYLTGFIFIQH